MSDEVQQSSGVVEATAALSAQNAYADVQYPAEIAALYTDLATVEVIEEVIEHPNADKLDLARVLDYWCVVGKDSYKVGDKIVFIAPDSVLPADRAWAASFIPYTKAGRVRAVRLRGEWSMGIILNMTVLDEWEGPWDIGADATYLLGVTKFEPKVTHGGNAKGGLPFQIPKTDETAWQKVRKLDGLLGSLVDVGLKIDGMSMTAYCVVPKKWDGNPNDLRYGITSRSLDLIVSEEANSPYHTVERKYDLLAKLIEYCTSNNVSLAVRGEVYGHGVQAFEHNPHSKVPLDLALHAVYNIDTGEKVGPNAVHNVSDVAPALGLQTVPLLACDVVLTRELIEKYDKAESLDGVPFEGVVIVGDGFSFKVINKNYDSRK